MSLILIPQWMRPRLSRNLPLALSVFAVLAVDGCTGSATPAPAPAPATAHQAQGCTDEERRQLELDPPGAGVEIRSALCREGFAFVQWVGDIGVHGTQAIFYQWQNGKWVDVAWGQTSHGQFTDIDLLSTPGVDGRRLAVLFPEAGVIVPSAEPGYSVIIDAHGVGELRIGMTDTQARAASPFPLLQSTDSVGGCTRLVSSLDTSPGILVLLRDGRVVAISIGHGAQTQAGIHVGSSTSELSDAYGDSIVDAFPGARMLRQGDSPVILFYVENDAIVRIVVSTDTSGTGALCSAH